MTIDAVVILSSFGYTRSKNTLPSANAGSSIGWPGFGFILSEVELQRIGPAT